MILRMPEFRNPRTVLLIMTKEEFTKYGDNSSITEDLQTLEVMTCFKREYKGKVILELAPETWSILTTVFIWLIGAHRFVTMRAEEFAQDLQDYGFTVEFS